MGFVWRGGDRIPFAELAEAAARETLPENLPVRGGLENRLVGHSLPRLDVPSKIDGTAAFAADIRVPDMIYAAVRSGPPGSRRVSINRAAADAIPGALAVVENPDWIAAAATNWWAAARALEALQPRYELLGEQPSSAGIAAALAAALDSGDSDRLYEAGDPDDSFAGASQVTARYDVGLAPSAPVETLTATARLIGDQLEVWAPTQAPALARAAAARAVSFGEHRVTLYPVMVGGGYGRKLETAAIEQAAISGGAAQPAGAADLASHPGNSARRDAAAGGGANERLDRPGRDRQLAGTDCGAGHFVRSGAAPARRRQFLPSRRRRHRRSGAALCHRQCRRRPRAGGTWPCDGNLAVRGAQLHLFLLRMFRRRAGARGGASSRCRSGCRCWCRTRAWPVFSPPRPRSAAGTAARAAAAWASPSTAHSAPMSPPWSRSR
jgi:hypothetical protein